MLFNTSLLVEDFRHSLILFVCFNIAPKNHGLVPQSELPLWFVCYTILNYANISVSNWLVDVLGSTNIACSDQSTPTGGSFRTWSLPYQDGVGHWSCRWYKLGGRAPTRKRVDGPCKSETQSKRRRRHVCWTRGIVFASSSLEGPNLIPAMPMQMPLLLNLIKPINHRISQEN